MGPDPAPAANEDALPEERALDGERIEPGHVAGVVDPPENNHGHLLRHESAASASKTVVRLACPILTGVQLCLLALPA